MDFQTRDPIYGWLSLPIEVKPIIDSVLFQRLYHVKQLSTAEVVYTGATHTRGAHSLGVGFIARKYASHLFPGDKEKELILVIGGLLHDIGHGPFSHIWDHVVYSKIYKESDGEGLKTAGHDQQRFKIVEYMKDIIDPIVPSEKILNVWRQATPEDNLLNLLIQGPLGADRIDFVSRDAYYTGTKHFGTISYERIIANSQIRDGRLCYAEKVMGDIVHAIRARMHMYREVYLHRTVVAAGVLLERAIEAGSEEMGLVEWTQDISRFHLLTDALVYDMARSGNDDCSYYANRYIERKLPKLVESFVTSPLDKIEVVDNSQNDDVVYKKSVVKDYNPSELDGMIEITGKDGPVLFSEALWDGVHGSGSLDMQACIHSFYRVRDES